MSSQTQCSFARCMICGSDAKQPVFAVDRVPVHPFRPPAALGLQPALGALAIVACGDCGHVYNGAFDPGRVDELYAASVLTNTPVSDSMIRNLEATADFILSRAPDRPSVVDVGGGTGGLALAMAKRAREVHLVEPSRALTAAQFAGTGVTLHQAMFPAPGLGEARFDVIVSRQVIEHIPDPLAFLRQIRGRLRETGVAYIETPSFEYIEDNASIVDFHYPHVHYYRRSVCEALFARSGFEVAETVSIKDGHDVGFLLRPVGARAVQAPKTSLRRDFSGILARRRSRGQERLNAIAGNVALYGANAYSQALLGLYPTAARYTAMFDDTAMYQGQRAYGPGVDIEIHPPGAALLRDVDAVVITAYLHDAVIGAKLRQLGFAGPICTVRADGRLDPAVAMAGLFDD